MAKVLVPLAATCARAVDAAVDALSRHRFDRRQHQPNRVFQERRSDARGDLDPPVELFRLIARGANALD